MFDAEDDTGLAFGLELLRKGSKLFCSRIHVCGVSALIGSEGSSCLEDIG